MNIPRFNRRATLRAALATCLVPMVRRHGQKCCADDPYATLYIADAVDQAVKNGVRYLAKVQKEGGAINDRSHQVAMTALAVMAMASIGTQPSESTELGKSMMHAIDFVLLPRHQNQQGYFGDSDGSRMYGHGIITLMLTEVLGMGATVQQNARIHAALVPALQLILTAQKMPKPESHRGGWRYTPTSHDSDLSASVWQLMALRSAKNDGVDVPGEAIEQAIDYLRESYTGRPKPGGKEFENSGFSYTPGSYQPTFTMTSAGLLAMQVCGLYDSPMVTGAGEWLLQHPPQLNERFFFYGIYYYAQGMHQMGGKYAKVAEPIVDRLLLDSQSENGSWQASGGEERNVGMVYATSLAVLSLSVRYHYLPIYQR
ncbi:prenyltransferase/squalene oxidase repeat-containing protein [Planctomycetes bacterium CA13]